ncbi:hypothetical protein JYT75_01010 [Oceanicaulis sp. AH-315-P02]|nr:hypothetical protein [Robiginitomaculum sp.]MBN4047879.1 hypothetical protein [Oceanicaulis sp. AH-315-P02]
MNSKQRIRIDEAIAILKDVGMPKEQINDRSGLTLLALADITAATKWAKLNRPLLGITPIMNFCMSAYNIKYAPNTRETFRRQTMHQFVAAGLAVYNPDKPDRPVNSPKACYQLSPDMSDLLRSHGKTSWKHQLQIFLKLQPSLAQQYSNPRNMQKISVTAPDGTSLVLSPGVHSQLISDIILEFCPRFAPGSVLIYAGDTAQKGKILKPEILKTLGVTVAKEGKLPDVVVYYPKKNWLLLIESVTSHGPVDPKRHQELEELFKGSRPGLVYVTAFPSRSVMTKYLDSISWETEVWVADAPEHLIHFNGDRFLGPH